MRLLLDEPVPRGLAASFPDHFEVQTVPRMGWAGTGNGALLRLAADHGFDALITVDRGIAHKQNPDHCRFRSLSCSPPATALRN